MKHTVTAICGDGIGQEVIPAAIELLEALNLDIEVKWAEAGFSTFEQQGTALPEATLKQIEASDAVLFGATQSPMTKVAGYVSPILSLRTRFNLYANLRPAIAENADMLIVRENTEGMYSKRETLSADGQTAIAERVITVSASRRIVELACEEAVKRRGKLTIVHKANVLKETCGLFRQVAFEVTANYPQLEVSEMLVDACAMLMAMDASRFDVIVTTNLFGDILSDLAAGLTGGPGLAPSANLGEGVPVFEPVHGSAPDIAGKGIADPRAAMLSLGMLLSHLAYREEAENVAKVVHGTAHEGSTRETTRQVIAALA
jgi:homoisocitrate dehydrogenase